MNDSLPTLVRLLQFLSGALWLVAALYMSPWLRGAWGQRANRLDALSARNCWLAWLQAGFSARWLAWRDAVPGMGTAELVCWAALYAGSGLIAYWFLVGAVQNRGR